MPSHHVERVLPYTPDQLFALVGDVARYPEFVPWITAMRATAPVPAREGVETLEAEAIDVGLVRGPFRRLTNRWAFVEAPGGAARVVFDIDFAFRTRLLDMLLAANFDRAVGKLIACFEGRAAALYGGGASPEAGPPRSSASLRTARPQAGEP